MLQIQPWENMNTSSQLKRRSLVKELISVSVNYMLRILDNHFKWWEVFAVYCFAEERNVQNKHHRCSIVCRKDGVMHDPVCVRHVFSPHPHMSQEVHVQTWYTDMHDATICTQTPTVWKYMAVVSIQMFSSECWETGHFSGLGIIYPPLRFWAQP